MTSFNVIAWGSELKLSRTFRTSSLWAVVHGSYQSTHQRTKSPGSKDDLATTNTLPRQVEFAESVLGTLARTIHDPSFKIDHVGLLQLLSSVKPSKVIPSAGQSSPSFLKSKDQSEKVGACPVILHWDLLM